MHLVLDRLDTPAIDGLDGAVLDLIDELLDSKVRELSVDQVIFDSGFLSSLQKALSACYEQIAREQRALDVQLSNMVVSLRDHMVREGFQTSLARVRVLHEQFLLLMRKLEALAAAMAGEAEIVVQVARLIEQQRSWCEELAEYHLALEALEATAEDDGSGVVMMTAEELHAFFAGQPCVP